ncbi:MAG: VanZ family protein, partial [Verrucomicrobiota bacterium]|nr:VanZ family protein [Verrucomicrobiota bacterium]
VLAWLWSWFLGPIDRLSSTLSNRAFQLSLGYGIFNEMIQAFIPQRFPSLGDVTMNAIGVLLGLYLHSLLCRTQKGSG